MDNINFIITEEENIGDRIDKYLSNKIEDKSRSFIQGLIDEKNVFVNNKNVKSNYKLRLNDNVTVLMKEPIELNVIPEDIDLNIVYEDEDLIVINKPQGMVVHPDTRKLYWYFS